MKFSLQRSRKSVQPSSCFSVFRARSKCFASLRLGDDEEQVSLKKKNRVPTGKIRMYHPPSNSTKTKVIQVTWYNLTLDLHLEKSSRAESHL